MIGALCSRSDHGKNAPKWTFTMSYRYQPSSRHFIGTVEQTQREINHNQIQNIYHLFDFNIERQLTPRWSVNASLPVLFAYRNQLYSPKAEYRVNSIGDMTVGGRAWIFRPPTESSGNIAVGMSLKLPTGKYNATGAAVDSKGNPIVATADQSIQAGDGGTGFAVDFQAFHPTPLHSMVYLAGSYLFNPRDTNGVATFRTRPGEGVMSVSDQYLLRGGIAHQMPFVRRVTLTLGGRWEGVPVRDLLGASNGFRRPGYAISLDPGLMYSHGRYLFSFGLPIAVERNRRRSVPDIANHTHGDAAFADYLVVFALSRRF